MLNRILAAFGLLLLTATASWATPTACESKTYGADVVMKITEAKVGADPLAHYKEAARPLLHFARATDIPPVVKEVFSTTFEVPPVADESGTMYQAFWTLEWPLWESTTPTFLRDSYYQQRILTAVKNELALATLKPTPNKPDNFTLTYLIEEDGKCVSELAYDEVMLDLLPPEITIILGKFLK